jgi:hypothetical protein
MFSTSFFLLSRKNYLQIPFKLFNQITEPTSPGMCCRHVFYIIISKHFFHSTFFGRNQKERRKQGKRCNEGKANISLRTSLTSHFLSINDNFPSSREWNTVLYIFLLASSCRVLVMKTLPKLFCRHCHFYSFLPAFGGEKTFSSPPHFQICLSYALLYVWHQVGREESSSLYESDM